VYITTATANFLFHFQDTRTVNCGLFLSLNGIVWNWNLNGYRLFIYSFVDVLFQGCRHPVTGFLFSSVFSCS